MTGDELTGAMVAIGMNLAADPIPDADIEDTLIAASIEGMDGDLRVLAMLTTWIGAHVSCINVDRLLRSLQHVQSKRVVGFWTAIGRWQHKDPRFARFRKLYRGRRIELVEGATAFLVERDGEDQRFAGGPLIVPAKSLRDRAADVASPAFVAGQHRAYYWRLIIGPTYRADLWAAAEANPAITISELARRARSSIGAAWQVKHDREKLTASAA